MLEEAFLNAQTAITRWLLSRELNFASQTIGGVGQQRAWMVGLSPDDEMGLDLRITLQLAIPFFTITAALHNNSDNFHYSDAALFLSENVPFVRLVQYADGDGVKTTSKLLIKADFPVGPEAPYLLTQSTIGAGMETIINAAVLLSRTFPGRFEPMDEFYSFSFDIGSLQAGAESALATWRLFRLQTNKR